MKKFLLFALLGAFVLPLLSWKSYKGIRIEKRRYRKGYYVHMWKTGKTDPQHTGVAVQSAGGANQSAGENSSADRSIEINETPIGNAPPPVTQPPPTMYKQADHSESIAPVSSSEPTRAIQRVNPPMPRN